MSLAPIETAPLSAEGVTHGFFTRAGGLSNGLYAGLNCGLGSSDDRKTVLENRALVSEKLKAETLLTVHQIHSADVVTITGPFEGSPPKADGMVTKVPGLALGALAADCAPLLFLDSQALVIGAAHSGWKGAIAGVGDNVVTAMEALGADRSQIAVVIGPTISKANYEVGPEFRANFLAVAATNDAFFAPSSRNDHFMFDLPGYLVDRLTGLGVGTVLALDECTYGQEERFYSYRRSCHRAEPDYGRHISAIALKAA